jgi:peptide-methionine (S)-S-oxide reductase
MSTEPRDIERVALAGGCFWCTEAVFRQLKGVVSVTSGYTGGHTMNPTYDRVCRGDTGHTEAILIDFDPNIIGIEDIFSVFFATHDPTTLNRQGPDIGTEYRSAIFFSTESQKQIATEILLDIPGATTEVAPLGEFFPAEVYNQNYYTNNKEQRYCELIINPKLEKFQKRFAQLLK